MTAIVVVLGSDVILGPATTLASEKSTLATLIEKASDPVTVSVISLGGQAPIAGLEASLDLSAAPRPVIDRILSGLGAYALRARLATIPIGRLLNSLGPVDQGRVFWRAVRRSPEAMTLIRSADVVIAADAPAIRTAWIAVRRGYTRDSFYDHRSAAIEAALPGSR